ncbi:membrane protein [Klebsiella pneumoniae]|uniref:Membrane protein n=1 Tax=Klebsiella pneumoniae TaxID=573 RepID=A0A4P0XXR5_KLEPN|nr:membrane protein [Klebsiella pneumoniae]
MPGRPAGELTPSDSQRLAQTMRVSPFDWRRLSRYAFWTALACVLISLGSLFADSELVAWLLSLFSHSALMRILLACAAGSRLLRLGFSSPAAGDAVALQHRGDFVSGRRLYRRGAMAAWRTAG